METFMDKSSEARLSRYDRVPYRSTDPPVEMENLQREVTKLVDHLTGIQKQLQVLSIVETSGTSSCSIQLVDKVYKHPLIQSHFEIRQRTTFREEHQMSGLLQCILVGMGCGRYVFNMSDEILGEMLKLLLMGRRFLILLNNMRDKSIWDDLRRYVPDNYNGSKVMFTDWPASMGLIPQPYQYPLVQQEEDETYGVHLYLFEAHIISFDASTSSIGKAEENVSNVKEEEIVGVEDEVMKLVERLTGEEKRLEVVSIVGMPGLGKTTLAKTVYNHTNVVYHFYVRAWTRVSQSYQKRDLLLAILGSIIELTSEIFDFTDVMLLELLRKRLLGRRYLVVMDDMWDFGAWDDLRRSFPDDKNGSKIMFTSRATNVAFHAQPNSPPYHLRFLTERESLQLLCRKVFQSKPCPSELAEIATEIAKKCKGLPLAIVVIAGILANEKTSTWWGQVAQSVNSLVVDNPEQYMDTLALSYNYLPLHLKSCFLYLGAFLEDREIPARKLILLWVAEGFTQQSGSKRLTEDVAEDFLMELINRSLIIVSRRGSDGRIKSCIIHDLLRELCLKKANEVKFMHRYEDKPSLSDPCTD